MQVLLIPVPTTRLDFDELSRVALPAPVEIPVLPALNDLHALLAAALQLVRRAA